MENTKYEKKRLKRLKTWNYSFNAYYFITICTYHRKEILGKIFKNKMSLSRQGKIVKKFWFSISNFSLYCFLDEFIVMPNHIHGIIVIDYSNETVAPIHELVQFNKNKIPQNKKYRRKMLLPKIIGKFKMLSAKEINLIQETTGNKFWQPNYYEHIIRNEKSLQKIREYIKFNHYSWKTDSNNSNNFN